MDEMDFLVKAINRVVNKLNLKTVNYVVEVGLYPISEEGDFVEVLKRIFRTDIVMGGVSESNNNELQKELFSGLSYSGDSGAHANMKYVGSEEHRRDLDNIKNKLKPLLAHSSAINSFWLKKGHPYYPVFWDFAFMVNGKKSFIIIGSASD